MPFLELVSGGISVFTTFVLLVANVSNIGCIMILFLSFTRIKNTSSVGT